MRFYGSTTTRHAFPGWSRLLPALFIAALCYVPMSATTIVAPTDEELIRKSSVVLSGTVLSSKTVEHNGQLFTETRVEVASVLRGDADQIITVRQAGGQTPARVRVVFGSPEFTAGERVLLFLTQLDDLSYEVNDLFLGKFTERHTTDGVRIWYRANEADGTSLLESGAAKAKSKADFQRDADRFEAFLRQNSTGTSASADYDVINPEFPGRISVSFATMAETDIHRWFRFDDGGTVSWHRVGEQAGFDSGGTTELEKALKVWSDFEGARIRFSYDGPVSRTAEASVQNGLNEILFNDPFGEIPGRWNGQSGVLAQAEYHAVKVRRAWSAPFEAGSSHPAKTYPEVWEIVEGNIVIQEGVSPFYRVGEVMLTQIIAHELGHTLGLAHSRDSAALMSSTIDGTGAFLRADDQLGASWLYPVSPNAPPQTSPETTALAVDFSVSNEFAEVAEALQLIDLSKGSPVSWSWSFGDGQTSDEKNPVHRYASAGAYLVTLTASNGSYTSSRSRSVVVTSEPLVHSLIPVATQTEGLAGTEWRTELSLFNGANETQDVTLIYLPQAGGIALTRTVAVAAGESLVYQNALPEVFGIASGTGAIEIRTSATKRPELIRIASRTFTGDEAGTYGQTVPHLSTPSGVNYITGIESSPAFRTNIGLVNRSFDPVKARMTILASTGESLGTTEVEVEGRSFQQTALTTLFPALTGMALESLSMQIEADRADALTSYASVIDNYSSDPFLVPGTPAGSRELIVPGAANTPGAGDTFWRTDVTMFNPAATAIEVEIRLLGQSIGRNVTLAAGGTAAIRNVIEWLDLPHAQGALQITTLGETGPVISARTYTVRDGGQGGFGQSIEQSDPRDWVSATYVTGVKSDDRFRTNAGIVNANANATEVEVQLHHDGATLSRRILVAAASQIQLSLASLFPEVRLASGATLTARSIDNVPIALYASVVDNVSGDPSFMVGH